MVSYKNISFLNSKLVNNTVKILGGIIVFTLLLYFLGRNLFLDLALHKIEEKIKSKYQLNLSLKEAKISGLSTLKIQKVKVFQNGKDTLFSSEKVEVELKFLPLLFAKVRVRSLFVDSTFLVLNKSKDQDNFSFLLKSKKKNPSKKLQESKEIDFASIADKLLDNIFENIPREIIVNNLSLKVINNKKFSNIKIQKLSLNHGNLESFANVEEWNNVSSWHIQGTIESSDRKANVKIFPSKKNSFIPIMFSFFNIKSGFDTLNLSINNNYFSNDELKIEGMAIVRNFFINHWRISTQDVKVTLGEIDYKCFLGANYLGVDSTTICSINNIIVNPYVKYTQHPNIQYELKLTMPKMASNDFFNSLPPGLFESFEGINTKGEISYNLNFLLNDANPDSLVFQSELKPHNLKINSYGNTNFSKINSPFLYTAYEKGKPFKTFMVGDENPYYAALDNISIYLRNAILCSEDGDFFWHKGFNERAFRKSIATNYKEKKFKRGGSTISMQLVKNVFLTRNKTVARKLEEALIVWLIENNRVVSKDRMYEVYLNIIEWGPGVYGVGEASEYYFKKRPDALNLSESIFLAMIIPRPKGFNYNFDDTGKLRPHTADFFRVISRLLAKREIISEEEKENVNTDVVLIGEAKSKLKIKVDTIPEEVDPMIFEYGGE